MAASDELQLVQQHRDGTRFLELRRSDGTRLCLDFTRGKTRFRAGERHRLGQLLARAVAPKRLRQALGRFPRVLDATAGLGQDGWFLAAIGCEVVMIEREPRVHALLEDALSRARNDPQSRSVAARIRLYLADATRGVDERGGGIAALCRMHDIDVVHLDPMYPDIRRRGASGKGMQFLHELTRTDDPQQALAGDLRLFDEAFASAARRIAIKRPAAAAATAAPPRWQPVVLLEGATRYDIFVDPE